jgi:hypothetical protein
MIRSGGKQTNINGLAFEKLSCNYANLINTGFEKVPLDKSCKNSFYLNKTLHGKRLYYTSKIGLRHLLLQKFNVKIHKQPDEAYLIQSIDDNTLPKLFIIEKKFQNVHGSVDEKLLACDGIRQMYSNIVGKHASVEYIFCLSNYYKNLFENNPSEKYILIKKIIQGYNVKILYGEDSDYFDKLNNLLTL